MKQRATAAAAFALLVLGTAACGDPYSAPDPHRGPTPPPGEQSAPRLRQPPDVVRGRDLAPTPEAAASRAAELTTNWTGKTAARNYAALASMTIGDARRDARESAARLPSDPQLAEARSTGSVEAIAPRGRATPGRRDLIVVTRETLTGDGLRERRWRVTLATARHRGHGWVLSRWEPQP